MRTALVVLTLAAITPALAGQQSQQAGFWKKKGAAIHDTDTGNVGIGATTPAAMLDAAGPVVVNGTHRPPALGRLAFVENLGQWNTPASFVASLGRTVVRAVEGGFVVDACPGSDDEWVQLRFELEGARPGVEPTGTAPLPGLRNYLRGDDPERWAHGARAFGQVVYAGLYEGVDLRLRDADGMPEYDLLLAPGADLSQVVVRCEGVRGLEVDEQGGLRMHSARGVLRQSPPVTWCVLPSGEREPLECEFVVLDGARFGFRLAEHDPDLPVVVDPGLEWATYLGGSSSDTILGMARNSNGEIVVAGTTFSPDFPTKTGPADYPGIDVFVSILDATGSALVASTLVGGAGTDYGLDVQVGAGDEVFVVGTTNSANFPVTASTAYLPTPQGKYDGFVVQLKPDLSQIDYASYLGGSEYDGAGAVRVRAPRVLTIAGSTRSTNFQAVTSATAVQPNNAGGNCDYFICRLDLDQLPASQLLYGTYLGGSAGDGLTGGSPFTLSDPQIHEAASGVVTLVGRTHSNNIVRTATGYDASFNSSSSTYADAYVARVDPSRSGLMGLVYDTYLGADLTDSGRALAVDSAGVITLGGWTDSPTFPTTPGAFGTTLIGPFHDGFITRLDPSQSPGAQQLLYSTLLSGDGYENVTDLVLDTSGRVLAQGYTGAAGLVSNSFPTTFGAFQRSYAGNNDGFLVYLDPGGNGAGDLLYSTFLGRIGLDERTFGLEILTESPTLRVLSAGRSDALGLPATPGAYQEIQGGLQDGLVLQLEIEATGYLVLGSSTSPGSFTRSGHTWSTLVSGISSSYAVLMESTPSFAFPVTKPKKKKARQIPVTPVAEFNAQVLLWNPVVYPSNTQQWSAGLDVTLWSNGRATARRYGSKNGITILMETYSVNGKRYVRFPFSIDGF